MKNFISILILVFSLSTVQAQSVSEAKQDTNIGNPITIEGEEFPSFPGGNAEFLKFIQKNLVYPQSAKENGISGKVYLKFVIKEDGSVDDVQIVRGIKDGEDLGVEAIRLMKLMPNWIPGKLNGKPVKVTYSVPLSFTMK